MNEKGSVSTEILVALIVILLIIGITAKFSEITLDKLATSTENENIELLLSQSADNLKWCMDNTRIKLPVVESVTSNKIYLNNRINLEFPIVDFSSIMFIHFNKKDVKALLVCVPKDFDKSKLDYDYFRTNNCEFILKGWY